MQISAHIEEWTLQKPFRISGKEWVSTRSVVVQVAAGGCVGRGEAQGIFYTGETAETMLAQVFAAMETIRNGVTRDQLLSLLPSGGARNAIDCALWDLEARQSGRSVWELTGIDPRPVTTVFTIGLEPEPEQMAANARAAAELPVLKIKLDADRPVERLAAIREARPNARLVVDANQGWSFELLQAVLPRAADLGVEMIEQPLPRGEDAVLEGFESPVLLGADESCLDTGDLDQASRRYGMINIKLDKTGGLTEALRLAKAAKDKGLKLMVGNMTGTSLSMAPSFVLAQLCDLVDIDGPLLLKNDHPDGLRYDRGVVGVFDPGFWG